MQSLGIDSPCQQRQKCLLAVLGAITRNEGAEPILTTAPKGCHSRGIINTIIEGSASARIYHCSISPGDYSGILIYIFLEEGMSKKVYLVHNQDDMSKS